MLACLELFTNAWLVGVFHWCLLGAFQWSLLGWSFTPMLVSFKLSPMLACFKLFTDAWCLSSLVHWRMLGLMMLGWLKDDWSLMRSFRACLIQARLFKAWIEYACRPLILWYLSWPAVESTRLSEHPYGHVEKRDGMAWSWWIRTVDSVIPPSMLGWQLKSEESISVDAWSLY